MLVDDLGLATEHRWPAFSDALLAADVHAVFALPVAVASVCIGVIELFRHAPGPLSAEGLVGAHLAAELAAVPTLDLMTADVDWESTDQTASEVAWAVVRRKLSLDADDAWRASGRGAGSAT